MPLSSPAHPALACGTERLLWVRAAVTRQHEPRRARELGEWTLEPVLGSEALLLSLALADGGALAVLLRPEDAEDLAAAVAQLRQADGAG